MADLEPIDKKSQKGTSLSLHFNNVTESDRYLEQMYAEAWAKKEALSQFKAESLAQISGQIIDT